MGRSGRTHNVSNSDCWVSPCTPVALVCCSTLAHLVSMPKEHIHGFYLAFQQTQHVQGISWLNWEFHWPTMTFGSSSFDRPDSELISSQTSWDSVWCTVSVSLSFADKAIFILGNDRLKTFCMVARNAGESIVQSSKSSRVVLESPVRSGYYFQNGLTLTAVRLALRLGPVRSRLFSG